MLKKTTEAVEQFRVKVLVNGFTVHVGASLLLSAWWIRSSRLWVGRMQAASEGPVIGFDISESLQLFLMYPRPAATFLCGLVIQAQNP
jgi:hypothetical protein